ncbi:MAG: tetratricopeptide repeat protein [Alphaproteobacteria bacterium]
MTDAFEEVEESLRIDRAGQLWKTYSPWLAGAAVALILAVAGYQIWKVFRQQAVEGDAKAFSSVMDDLEKKDLTAARDGLTKLSTGKTGFASLADHVLAGIDETNPKLSAEHLQAAVDQKNGLMSDLALLKLAYVKADTATLPELETLVAPLEKKGGPMGALSRELVAAKAAAARDVERARTEYTALSLDLDAPQAMQQRVNQAMSLLPPKPAAAPAPAAPAPAAAGKKIP